MLLALRRWLGLGAPVTEGVDPAVDRKTQKWVIEPARVGLIARAEELWRYRRILWFFASRRVKERYEDKTLGKFWMFAQPLAPILISTVIFGSMLQVPSDGVPYFLFFLAGMSCWRIFERGVASIPQFRLELLAVRHVAEDHPHERGVAIDDFRAEPALQRHPAPAGRDEHGLDPFGLSRLEHVGQGAAQLLASIGHRLQPALEPVGAQRRGGQGDHRAEAGDRHDGGEDVRGGDQLGDHGRASLTS